MKGLESISVTFFSLFFTFVGNHNKPYRPESLGCSNNNRRVDTSCVPHRAHRISCQKRKGTSKIAKQKALARVIDDTNWKRMAISVHNIAKIDTHK